MGEEYLSYPEIHRRCLGILEYVDQICREEGITYWLSGGTLLGAVRHKGFIPWDDDVDLMMPRPEYERFLQLADRCSNDWFRIVHASLREDYATPWIRVWDLGTQVDRAYYNRCETERLFVDIFPVDALPANPLLSELFFKRVLLRDILLQSSRRLKFWPTERFRALKRLLMVAASVRSPNAHARALERFCGRRNYERARYRGVCVVTNYGKRERMPSGVFDSSVDVEFCGKRYPAPVGWDRYLSGLYGNYMQLPPVEKRQSKHRFMVRLRDPAPDK